MGQQRGGSCQSKAAFPCFQEQLLVRAAKQLASARLTTEAALVYSSHELATGRSGLNCLVKGVCIRHSVACVLYQGSDKRQFLDAL